MSRVKGRILMEKKKISHVEDRKRNQRLKKYHKEVMVEKQKSENKKQAQSVEDEINKWKGNNAGKKDATLQEILKNARKEYIENKKNQKKTKPNMKRITKNLRYGHTASKIMAKDKKRNTFASTNAFHKDWVNSMSTKKGNSTQNKKIFSIQ